MTRAVETLDTLMDRLGTALGGRLDWLPPPYAELEVWQWTVALGCLILSALCGVALCSARATRRTRAAWPQVTATVRRCTHGTQSYHQIVTTCTSDGRMATTSVPSTRGVVDVTYAYELGGTAYEGSVRFGSSRLAAGDPLPVWVNPDRPSQAVLSPDDGSTEEALVGLVLFAVLGLAWIPLALYLR